MYRFIFYRTLWDASTLQDSQSTPIPDSRFTVKIDHSISDRADTLNIEAGAKMSLAFGLISGSASGRYLSEASSSSDVAQATMTYRVDTVYKYLSMEHLALENIEHPQYLRGSNATHIVVGKCICSFYYAHSNKTRLVFRQKTWKAYNNCVAIAIGICKIPIASY